MATTRADVVNERAETRGQRLWQRLLEQRKRNHLSLHRAKLVMVSYKENEGQPSAIRAAHAFEKIMDNIPIFIGEEDLLVGAFSAEPMAFEWHPEYTVRQVKDPCDPFVGDVLKLQGIEIDQAETSEIVDYFSEKCLDSVFLATCDERIRNMIKEHSQEGSFLYDVRMRLEYGPGYNALDYEKVITRGFSGILADIEELKKPLGPDKADHRTFLEGLEIVLRAGIRYANRYASLARAMAKNAEPARQQELERIASICEWVPANPARTFYEALQAVWFLHVIQILESRSIDSLGRMDYYLYPYYQQDIAQGKTSGEEVIELLECFRVKMSSLRNFRTPLQLEASTADAQYHNVTLGGQTIQGEDATNELSYLFLEAAFRTRAPHPTLTVRWHNKLDGNFALRALELIRTGIGFPAFYNDNSAITFLLNTSVPLEKARNYAITGCVDATIPGETGPNQSPYVIIPKYLELALFNGVDPRTGQQIGPATGRFADFVSYEKFVNALKKQITHFCHEGSEIINAQDAFREAVLPYMLASCFVDDCIGAGTGPMGSGARYHIFNQIAVGMIDVVDSLAAIKKLVFDEAKVGREELLGALMGNFQEKEELRQALLAAPKYGNDQEYVDQIATDLYDWLAKMVSDIDGLYGAKNLPNAWSVSVHGAAGKRVGALPSGRLAGLSLADGSMSACQSMDTSGPTALINSAGKIDQSTMLGDLLNMKFHPSALKTKDDLRKLLALIKTYFEYGGRQIQFNVVDKNTLLDAQEHPERHRNLIIRVAGYSAFFTELQRTTQDEIITRTEYGAV